MSRIGKQPIAIPAGVEVKLAGRQINIKGPKGSLTFTPHEKIDIKMENSTLTVSRKGDEKLEKSLHGLTRTLVSNMIEGVTKGFAKSLEIQGVGYRVAMKEKNLELSLGFSHPVGFKAPEGITFEIDKEKKNIVTVHGIDKALVGLTAANLRSLRKPEPYKGKGIRYVGEIVRRKAGKAAAAAAKSGGA